VLSHSAASRREMQRSRHCRDDVWFSLVPLIDKCRRFALMHASERARARARAVRESAFPVRVGAIDERYSNASWHAIKRNCSFHYSNYLVTITRLQTLTARILTRRRFFTTHLHSDNGFHGNFGTRNTNCMWRQVNWFQVTKGAFLGNILVTIRVQLRDEIRFIINHMSSLLGGAIAHASTIYACTRAFARARACV